MDSDNDVKYDEPFIGIIYSIENRKTKQVYIGSTRCRDLLTRITRHLESVALGSRYKLHSAIRLVGIKHFSEHFEWHELERRKFATKDEMLQLEQKHIEARNANHTLTGYNAIRAKLTREEKNRIMLAINHQKHKKDIENKRFYCDTCELACPL
jgi:hypothetical protein